MRKKYVALRGANRDFFEHTGREAILAGPAETGKTFTGILKLHTLLTKYPGAQIAIIRKVYHDLKGTALITYRRDILELESFKQPHAYVKPFGGENPEFFDYPNGARLWVGGLDNPGKTLSAERDVIYVVQAEQLSLSDWEYLMRCTTGRGAKMPYTQLIGDCNPAQQTHWILSRQSLQLFNSKHSDNPTLYHADGTLTAQGERSLADLQSLTGVRYKRLFQGQWSAPEGMIYDVFDSENHVIKAFGIPANWPRVLGVDPFGDVVSALWLALDPQAQAWHVYREYMGHFGATTEGHVNNILALTGNETLFYCCGGGPSERQARADFSGYGLPLLAPAVSDVWAQIDRVYSMFKANQLFIHDTCPQLISETGEYHRISRGGEVLDNTIDDKGKYHALDALRYGVTGPAMNAAPTTPYTGFQNRTGINY